MAKTPTGELFSTLKSYFNQLTEGERTPTEVAAAFNEWARESADSIKAKISEEVEETVSKMGFVQREEYEKLVKRIAKLEEAEKSPAKTVKKSPAKKPVKSPVKKSPVKKSPAKKASK